MFEKEAHLRRLVAVLAVAFAGIAAFAFASASASPTHEAAPLVTPPHPVDELGRVYDDLDFASTGPCAGFFQIRGTTDCTHGPDPVPEGGDRLVISAASSGFVPAPTVETKVPCVGDGTSGKRVQVMYVRAADAPDNYAASRAAIGAAAVDVDRIFRESAAETSGTRHVRWVHDAACNLSILDVVLDPSAIDNASLGATDRALKALGYNSTDRKYLLFVDHSLDPADDVNCGVGTIKGDSSAGAGNRNNDGPGYARVGPNCWNKVNSTAAHELMHTLGGVQKSAPHISAGWHCTDEYDRMCYDDDGTKDGVVNFPSGGSVPMTYPCDSTHERLFDCNHDDYFSTNPPTGSYLATSWNTANSDFLVSDDESLWGFVWANDPAASSYTPIDDYNQNSTYSENTPVNRNARGVYDVTFTNLAGFGAKSGTVLVTAKGSSAEHCTTSAWFTNGTPDRIATVRCFDAAGNTLDAQYDASYIRPIAAAGPFAYLWANDEEAPSYTPSPFHQFNSTGASNTITHNSPGNYLVTLPGLSSDGGTVKVTAFSATSNYCKASTWWGGPAGENVRVLCFDRNGTLTDTKFTLVFADRTSILANDGPSGYLLANRPTTASYQPNPAFQYNSTGAVNSVTRTGVGSYTATLPGLGTEVFEPRSLDRGTLHVTATQSLSTRCEVSGWHSTMPPPGTPIDLIVDVACATPAGAPADSEFALQFTK